MTITVDPARLSAASALEGPEAPTDVVLSLCVPTYNRARFLEHLFPHIREASQVFDFSYEIVVSDNASPDDTAEVVARFKAEGLPIRYFRQEENKRLSNQFSAFRHARGEFLVYLADDDLMIPEALADNIRFMMENPQIRVVYTPFEIYDALNGERHCLFYHLRKPVEVFQPGQEVDLLKMLVENHVMPEIGIYRAEAVRQLVSAPQFCYWAFAYLATMVSQGPVAFRDVPYYRSVTLTPVMPNRHQEGTHDNLYNWDAFRGGLEFMVFSLLKRLGLTPDRELQRIFRDMVDSFLSMRMHVSLRLWLGRRDYLKAYELITRLSYLNPASVRNIAGVEQLLPLVRAQVLAQLANGIAEIDRLILDGIDDVSGFETTLRDLGLKDHIAVVASSTVGAADDTPKERSFVFLRDEARRAHFMGEGFEKGLIVSTGDIESNFPI
ncbi:glycosyltransferase family 2 protein [Jiella endophytica]|uniref:Glycosyltransferase family 2 protein n=1 Tax=Jiella endophytica TaxID=2558362 RepID=A0A4Y8RH43_9HYPH|nr:glycosyltransferase family 2 protein [Jiella endophytica]TFF21811.1 glycosyltransferase family 2 protein [Jiella endophytica]